MTDIAEIKNRLVNIGLAVSDLPIVPAMVERLAEQIAQYVEQQSAALEAAQARVEELTDALNEDALVMADTSRRVARLREVLTDLVGAVVAEVNDPQKGGSGYLLARLSDARAALAEPVAVAATGEE